MTHRFGHSEGLEFELSWSDDDCENVEQATNARFTARIAGDLVWGGTDTDGDVHFVEWALVDLLEFCADRWDWLRYEESYPISFAPAPDRPSQIWDAAEDHWENAGEQEITDEEEALFAFTDRHDLARAFPGMRLPSIWLLRRGNGILLESEPSGLVHRPVDEPLETLSKLGDFVAERLQTLDSTHAETLLDRWNDRGGDVASQARIYTGLDEDQIEVLRPRLQERAPDGDFVPDTVFAAARQLGGHLSTGEFTEIVEKIGEIPLRETPELDTLSGQLDDDRYWESSRPFEEGYRLAEILRNELLERDYLPDYRSPLAPRHLLETEWNVDVDEISLEDPRIDAVAIWGPDHGPAVLLNSDGQHAQQERGKRATLAHEICHLLVDRQSALPLAEVLNRSLPRGLEQRANAFAAELLLPREVAGNRALSALEDRRPARKMVDNLCRSYGVSREVTAWQIRRSHAYSELPSNRIYRLSRMVSNPERY